MGMPISKAKSVHPSDKTHCDLTKVANGLSNIHIKTFSEIDVKIPLSEREIFDITRSWRTISTNMVNTGVSMFMRMFETSSEVRDMFEQFRTVEDVSDLRTSRALENHALLVMTSLDEAITNLDDETYLVQTLLETGKSHRRFENFGPHIFWAIEEPFITSVKQTLADKYSARMEKIYRKAIRFILTTLILGFEEDVSVISE